VFNVKGRSASESFPRSAASGSQQTWVVVAVDTEPADRVEPLWDPGQKGEDGREVLRRLGFGVIMMVRHHAVSFVGRWIAAEVENASELRSPGLGRLAKHRIWVGR
jgi:hypothetical protein